MSEQTLLIFLIIHIICVVIYAILILSGISRHHKEFIAILLFVPGFGLLAGLVVELYYKIAGSKQEPIEISDLALDEDIYWKPVRARREETDLVPLEEALSINDTPTRRKLMLESLYDNPSKYIDVLMEARKNDDIETVHYAATTISKIQRDFQLEIQRLAVEVETDPDNIALLDQYIEIVQNYIDCDILEDYLLKRQRLLFDDVLKRRIDRGGIDKDILIKKINNNMALGNYQAAMDDSSLLTELWSDDEQVWIDSLRVCVESRDADKLREVIREIEKLPINWSGANRKLIMDWVENSQL
ncbi:MAG TPA: hypothetical protein DCK95_07305 [Anaerolineaceae bacterium]|nr:hypothetical protein [Anaerolineaceae bacterium]